MNITRFFAPTNREVMRQVRQALGPDALIISSRGVDGGVEVMATDPSALDDDGRLRQLDPALASVREPAREAARESIGEYVREPVRDPVRESAASPAQRAGAAYSAMTDSALAVVEDDTPQTESANSPAEAAELRLAMETLRGTLENRIDGLIWNKGLRSEPVVATLFRTLLEAGFSAVLIRAMLDRLPRQLNVKQALNWARNELISHLPVLRHEDDLLGSGGVFALVGPTGVGKTTTLAKLAARCVAREGREQVAMLTTDNFRIGAHEQLQIYGRLLGVPTRSVRDTDELRKTLAELGSRKIILIDTTGISQRDRHVAEQAAMLCGAGRPVQRLVVLNAASQGDTLDEVAHAYRNGDSEDVRGCIITKVDEASRYAAALDTAIRHRLPIHYVSRGQRVPEHMEVPSAAELIDGAFACMTRQALYTPSESDLAALWSATRNEAGGDFVDPVRRRQLLASAVLRPQGNQANSEEEMDNALAWMNTDPACVQARSSWRNFAGQSPLPTDALWRKPLEMARTEFPATCLRHVLAIHGKAPLKGEGLPGGVLSAALLMSDRGTALASPAQQLMLEHGVVSTFGAHAAPHANAADALASRINWLGGEMPQLPLVHLIESGTGALWQSLSDQGHAWLSRCTGGLKVVQDDTPTTLQAVGKTLGYVPVGQAGDMPGLNIMTDNETQPLRLWAAGTQVALAVRGNPGSMLRLVCAKLIGPGGKVVTQLYGLTSVGVAQADAAAVARWLVLQDQAKSAFRFMVHAWQPLSGTGVGDDALVRQSLMAGQLGAACWQLAHAPSGAVMRRLLQSLMGPERKLPARLLPPALLRLFAMVEMAG